MAARRAASSTAAVLLAGGSSRAMLASARSLVASCEKRLKVFYSEYSVNVSVY